MGPFHDTIVPYDSQLANAADVVTVDGIVHANLCQGVVGCPDTGETQSLAVFGYIYTALTGGSLFQGPTANGPSAPQVQPLTVSAPSPVFDLTGYTQAAATNVAFSPANNSALTVNSTANLTATSSTKTITEVLLYQAVSDYTDIHQGRQPFPPPACTCPAREKITVHAVFL